MCPQKDDSYVVLSKPMLVKQRWNRALVNTAGLHRRSHKHKGNDGLDEVCCGQLMQDWAQTLSFTALIFHNILSSDRPTLYWTSI